jgi:hypothetical protein
LLVTRTQKNLDHRAQRALEAFQGLEIIYFYDLPYGVGPKTMALLVGRGIVQVVDESVGRYAKKYAWQLVR